MSKEPTPTMVLALADLLLKVFVPLEDIREWIPLVTGDDEVTGNLPLGLASRALAHKAAIALSKLGWLGTKDFWNRLEEKASAPRKPEVRDLRAQFILTTQTEPPAQHAHPKQPPTAQPMVLTVLLVSATPDDKVRLRVDAEFRDIIDKVAYGPGRDRIRFEQVHAARFADLRAALIRYEPHILHISSHGEDDGSLQFENRHTTGAQAISKRRMFELLDALNDRLRLVVLNACDSHVLARDIPQSIDLAVGMNTPVSDQAAIDFSVSFYETLASGRSVEKAFKVARASLEDDEHETPELFPLADNDPDNKRKLVLVKPA